MINIKPIGTVKNCRNCGDMIPSIRKTIPLCAVCRRTYGLGAFIGGVGVVLKIIEHCS